MLPVCAPRESMQSAAVSRRHCMCGLPADMPQGEQEEFTVGCMSVAL